jgi:hypothetical protein
MASFDAPPIIDAKTEKVMPFIQALAVTLLAIANKVRLLTEKPAPFCSFPGAV